MTMLVSPNFSEANNVGKARFKLCLQCRRSLILASLAMVALLHLSEAHNVTRTLFIYSVETQPNCGFKLTMLFRERKTFL